MHENLNAGYAAIWGAFGALAYQTLFFLQRMNAVLDRRSQVRSEKGDAKIEGKGADGKGGNEDVRRNSAIETNEDSGVNGIRDKATYKESVRIFDMADAVVVVIRVTMGAALAAAGASFVSIDRPVIAFGIGVVSPELLRQFSSFSKFDSDGIRPSVDVNVPIDRLKELDDILTTRESRAQGDERISELETRLLELSRGLDREVEAQSRELRQQQLLIDMYEQGLRDSRTSFRVSILGAIAGALIVFAGVGMGVFKNGSDGQMYASIVATLAGATIDIVAGVFIVQSSQARKHLARLVAMLRHDQQVGWRVAKALSIASSIGDSGKQDELHEWIAKQVLNIEISTALADGEAQPDDAKAEEKSSTEGGSANLEPGSSK
ncbi:hypothetical protein [Actinomadura sp. NPDC048394]|jgi:hypothetical protein|uniref:TRADD-N-associated membrane domain-containing protein n=1 Tax=Actinomadura sp. NPDC048394 TaxID=3158223 RepID=UPI0033E0528D